MSSTMTAQQSAAAAEAQAVFFEALDTATHINVKFARYYAASIAGLIALFTIVHWTHIIFINSTSKSNAFGRTVKLVSTPYRRLLEGYAAGTFLILPGRLTLALVYFGINIALMFSHLNFDYDAIFLAKRCGWLALCNLVFTIFLALKNTPLSPLAGRSYESINVLHRCAGYTTIVAMLLHSSVFIQSLVKSGSTFLLMMPGQYAAVFAAFSLITIGITASSFFRKRQYELFFIIHVTLVAGILIALIFHLKQINWSAIAALIVAASIWFADRSLRFSRWLFYGYGNYCKLTPLPEGATRVTMHRSIKARPGSHAFLWIPSVRAFQTHPFTLVSNNPAEFVVDARDGFTKELHRLALENPKAMRRAAIEGPYGNMPSANDFDKVLLIAGGSGATCTLAMALDWVRRNKYSRDNRVLDFVWAVKSRDYLTWFEHELFELQSSPKVNLTIHVTGNRITKSNISSPLPNSPQGEEQEGELSSSARSSFSKENPLSRTVQLGRPDIDAIIRQSVAAAHRDDRILVAASGPARMLSDTRVAVKYNMSSQSASIHLHLEEFGW